MKTDVYEKVTAAIVAELEKGVRPWFKPWNADHAAGRITRPLRSNGVAYRGINVLMLWAAACERGYSAPIWMTFKQALELGGNVRKGEKGNLVVYANTIKRTEADPDTGEEQERDIPFMKGYTVFNVEQVEKLPEHFYALADQAMETVQRIAHAESFSRTPARRSATAGNRAFYSPGEDRIQMPPFEAFKEPEAYYATLAHESTHWTKGPGRIDRDFGRKRWGDDGYAAEELIVRRVGANKGMKICLLDSWENPCVPDLPVPVMNRLKSRNGNGTIACREKAQTAETIVGRAGHRKMRMAKATLPELQSSGFYPRQRRSDGCNAAPCRNRFAHENRLMKGVWQPSAPGPVGTACPPSVGSKGRTERLPASHLLVRVNTGSPKWARQRPTWRQSRHNSQTPG